MHLPVINIKSVAWQRGFKHCIDDCHYFCLTLTSVMFLYPQYVPFLLLFNGLNRLHYIIILSFIENKVQIKKEFF